MKVLFEKRNGVGIVELNNPTSLNACDTEMYLAMEQTLRVWEHDKDVAMVFLHSKFPKAFCSGGDVKSVVLNLQQKNLAEAVWFFEVEYAFDAFLHKYSKPVLGWAHGYCMGGGLGLLQACHLRVAEMSTQFSMPEALIGFFPDVGASYFLANLPHRVGLFLALTSARMTAEWAKSFNLVDAVMVNGQKELFLQKLSEVKWTVDFTQNLLQIRRLLEVMQVKEESGISEEILIEISRLVAGDSLLEVNKVFREFLLGREDHPFFREAFTSYLKSCPMSLAFIFELFTKHKSSNFIQALERDLKWARLFCQNHNFVEGVRAQLIDKDKNPQWRDEPVGVFFN